MQIYQGDDVHQGHGDLSGRTSHDRTHTRGDLDQELLPLAEKTAKRKGKKQKQIICIKDILQG